MIKKKRLLENILKSIYLLVSFKLIAMESIAKTNFWKSFKFYAMVSTLLGKEYFIDPNMNFVNRRCIVSIIMLSVFYLQFVYSIYFVYGDFALTMKAMYPLGVVFQVMKTK